MHFITAPITAVMYLTDEMVRRQIMKESHHADEYFANHGRSNINFVHGLYFDVIPQHLGEDGGQQSWARLLDAGTSRTLVALAILQSPEGIQEQVELMYLRLLRREADPAGLNTFTAALEAGLPSSLALSLIMGSDEYLSEG